MLDDKTFERSVIERPTLALLPFFEDGTFDFMPDADYLKFQYKAICGADLQLDEPVTFNDKIAWLKLHDRRPVYRKMADKLAARDIVRRVLGESWLVPLLGVWDRPEDVDFDALPDAFVLKCTNGYGGTIICRDKKALDVRSARLSLGKTLSTDYFSRAREWAYGGAQPRIMCESLIDGSSNRPVDYKFMCFNGLAKVICVSRAVSADHMHSGSVSFFDRDGVKLAVRRQDYPEFSDPHPFPECFIEMRDAAEGLARNSGAPFVRVDMYCTAGHPYFSEFTFYPCGGTMFLEPESYGRTFGDMLALPIEEPAPFDDPAGFRELLFRFDDLHSLGDFEISCLYRDYLHARGLYACEPIDYLKYAFWARSPFERSEVLTRRRYANLTREYNDQCSVLKLREKSAFEVAFRPFLQRRVYIPGIDSRETFERLCDSCSRVVLKSSEEAYGRGVRVLSTDDRERLFEESNSAGLVLEEYIDQHVVLNNVFPHSVNCVRVVTAIDKMGEVNIVSAVLRCGRGAMSTDSGEGLFAPIDVRRGVVYGPATTHYRENFAVHPDTGIAFDGLQLPNWVGFLATVRQAALHVLGLRLMNWDWACTASGAWALVEGNFDGGVGPCQEAAGHGLAHALEKILSGEMTER